MRLYAELSSIGKMARIVLLSIRIYSRDKIADRAQALTFYTLFAIVPFAALCFGIAKGFALEQLLKNMVSERLADYPELVHKVFTFAETALAQAQGGLIAAVGVALLFMAVVRMGTRVENVFNQLWRLPRERNFLGRINSYITLLVLAPFLIIVVNSSTVIAQTFISSILMRCPAVLGRWFTPALAVTNLLPYFIAWTVFSGIYYCVPNTRVHLWSAMIGGVLAGTVFQLLQAAMIVIQVGLSNYNTVYGSFAAVPLILLWMQWSWQVILFGAVLAYVHQNAPSGKFELGDLLLSRRERRKYLLAVARLVIASFAAGEGSISLAKVSEKLHLPLSLAHDLLKELVNARVLLQAADSGYLPGRPAEQLTVLSVFELLDTAGESTHTLPPDPALENLDRACAAVLDAASGCPANRPLKEIE